MPGHGVACPSQTHVVKGCESSSSWPTLFYSRLSKETVALAPALTGPQDKLPTLGTDSWKQSCPLVWVHRSLNLFSVSFHACLHHSEFPRDTSVSSNHINQASLSRQSNDAKRALGPAWWNHSLLPRAETGQTSQAERTLPKWRPQ